MAALPPTPSGCPPGALPGSFPSGRRAWLAGLLLATLYVGAALALEPDYGPTWDAVIGEYPYGETFLAHLGEGELDYLEATRRWSPELGMRQPHPDFGVGKRLRWVGTYPFTGFLSAISCRILWTGLDLVPPLIAHDLVILPFVGLLVVLITGLVGKRYGIAAGIAGSLFLLLSPRFFAHAFNNLKDVPEAALYGVSYLAFYAALSRRSPGAWIGAGALLGISLAQRPNAFFLPLQVLILLGAAKLLRRRSDRWLLRWSWNGAFLAGIGFAATYFLVSPVLWTHTWERLREWSSYTFGFNSFLNPASLALASRAGPSGISTEAARLVLVTTPLPLLALAFCGALAPGARAEHRLFLALGAAFPIGRTMIPGFPQYDGVRHFLEFYPPLCALAGLGVRFLLQLARARIRRRAAAQLAGAAIFTAALGPLAWATASTHPNGICYFNALIGGLRGAQAARLRDATDYWCNSYWQGEAWLNRNAEPGASLIVPIADHVVRCAAPIHLRADIHLPTARSEPPDGPLYVMYVTRIGLYDPLTRELEAAHEPIHEIRVQGAAILRIHRLERGSEAVRAFELRVAHLREHEEGARLLRWLRADPLRLKRAIALLGEESTLGEEQTRSRLEALVPEELRPLIPRLMREFGSHPAAPANERSAGQAGGSG